MPLTFGTGAVAHALGMRGQALGNLVRELIPDRPAGQHYRYTPAEVLWLAAYRNARAAGLDAWPAKALIGGAAMRAMLQALLAAAAPDPAEAVERLRGLPIMYGARFRFTVEGHESELVGEPLLMEAQRLPAKLAEPCIAAGGVSGAELTAFATPIAPPLSVVQRLMQETKNGAA